MAIVPALVLASFPGCCPLPINAMFRGDANVGANVAGHVSSSIEGPIEVKIPPVNDPGPVCPVVVRGSANGAAARVGLIDVDGLLLNQNLSGLYSVGENPVASFREKLDAAAVDPSVRAVVIRINSAGGSVTACDIMAEDLDRFREATGKPVVCCLMDLATAGAYYLAVGGDRVVAHPTSVTGGVGALINHYNLQDAMAQLNLRAEPIKSGKLVDMGSVTSELPEESRRLLQEMADGLHDRFRARVAQHRASITPQELQALDDGRVVPATKALKLHLIDRLGYVDDAIAEAERLGGVAGAEVALFQRRGYPAHSIYAITPNVPIQGEMLPLSYPALDRSKIPTFLYLWQPDPTLLKQGGR